MKIFLTGGTGAIGDHVVPALIEAGHRLTVVSRSTTKSERLTTLGATPVTVDLFSPDAVAEAVSGHDAVVNLATNIPRAPAALFRWSWKNNDRIRTEVSANLTRAARHVGVDRFIQESIAFMYADAGASWLTETSPLDAPQHTRTALVAEEAANTFTADGGTGVVLRFGYFYSADDAFSKSAIASVKRGSAPAFGHEDGYHPAIALPDAASAVVAALTLPAGTYNVVDDEPLTRRQYFDALAAALGAAPPKFLPGFAARILGSVGELMTRSLRVSNRILRDAGTWRPAYPSAREGWAALAGHQSRNT